MYPKIVSVLPNEDFTLKVKFSDEKEKLYDIKPLLSQESFQDLIIKLNSINKEMYKLWKADSNVMI